MDYFTHLGHLRSQHNTCLATMQEWRCSKGMGEIHPETSRVDDQTENTTGTCRNYCRTPIHTNGTTRNYGHNWLHPIPDYTQDAVKLQDLVGREALLLDGCLVPELICVQQSYCVCMASLQKNRTPVNHIADHSTMGCRFWDQWDHRNSVCWK